MQHEPDLSGRTVLITGASRGLGAALAIRFAQAGARLGICARDASALERVASAVRDAGADCLATGCDVGDAAEVDRWVRSAEERLGAPAVLVNNASVLGPRVPLAEHDVDEWRRTIEVNLTGAFLATRAVLRPMLGAGGGSIINVSSGAAIPPREAWGAYAVSKHALEGFSLNLAEELAGTGVRVNIVDPGAMRTEMRAEAYPDEDPLTLKTPEDRTGVFLWLASDDAANVSGQRFRADDWRAG